MSRSAHEWHQLLTLAVKASQLSNDHCLGDQRTWEHCTNLRILTNPFSYKDQMPPWRGGGGGMDLAC